MEMSPPSSPVRDSVPKIGEVAVGEDLDFQRRWWVFERLIWGFFLILILCDVLGLFGHGWLAEATKATPNGDLTIEYERVERASTPSTMVLRFGQRAIRDGRIRVFVSDSIVKELGAQRISPQPAVSAIGDGGITYTFPATAAPATVQISLQPTAPGLRRFRVNVAGEPSLDASVFVMP